jgi:hypothetical protein
MEVALSTTAPLIAPKWKLRGHPKLAMGYYMIPNVAKS